MIATKGLPLLSIIPSTTGHTRIQLHQLSPRQTRFPIHGTHSAQETQEELMSFLTVILRDFGSDGLSSLYFAVSVMQISLFVVYVFY